jgi:hypothetical protein
MAIKKTRRQVVMSPAEIAAMYADWRPQTTPEPAPEEERPVGEGAADAPATRTFAKPPEARRLEARARARTLGVKVAMVVEARRYVTASQSVAGQLYTIERTPIGWACECEGYLHTGCCKHLGAVERRAEREGWDFGRIAPLAKVTRYFPLDPQTLIVRGAVLVARAA